MHILFSLSLINLESMHGCMICWHMLVLVEKGIWQTHVSHADVCLSCADLLWRNNSLLYLVWFTTKTNLASKHVADWSRITNNYLNFKLPPFLSGAYGLVTQVTWHCSIGEPTLVAPTSKRDYLLRNSRVSILWINRLQRGFQISLPVYQLDDTLIRLKNNKVSNALLSFI